MLHRTAVALAIALTAALSGAQIADLSWGGTPVPLKGSSAAVHLTQEKVSLEINDGDLRYDCTYTFKNESTGTVKVILGFPDHGIGVQTDNYNDLVEAAAANEKPKPKYEGLKFFTVYVGGKEVDSSLEAGEGSSSYHVKPVFFGASGTQTVRATYRVRLGRQPVEGGGFVSTVRYSVAGEEAWHDPIDFKMSFKLADDFSATGITVKPLESLGERPLESREWPNVPAKQVMYGAPILPAIDGLVLNLNDPKFHPKAQTLIDFLFDYGA